MRLLAALKSDIKFQLKQGFYLVYTCLTILYLLILYFIPEGVIKTYAVPLTIFTDPAIIGYFFIGSIVMLEKQQGIIDALAVTPLDPKEYLISKAISLSIIGLISSLLIATLAGGRVNWLYAVAGILLNSLLYTLFGFIAAGGAKSVNSYFLRAIPMMLIVIFPCFTLIDFPFSWLFRIFPSVAGLELMIGSFTGINMLTVVIDGVILCIWIWLLFLAALKTYDKKILAGGGNNE